MKIHNFKRSSNLIKSNKLSESFLIKFRLEFDKLN